MIKDADNNKDNKIDLNDFKEIMRLAKWLFLLSFPILLLQ